jgi:hypothetical protein
MHRKCKNCSICGKRALKRLANYLADVHELSSEERQPYLIRANPIALDLENVLAELHRLIGNSKKQSKWNKSGIKNIPIRQPKSSRKRTKSNTKSAKNLDNTEQGQRNNLSTTKMLKLCSHIEVPRRTKWIGEDESNTMMKAATTTNRITKLLKQVTIYIRSITL